jgi:hypothetical protein
MIIVWVLFVSLSREEADDRLPAEAMSREPQPFSSLDRGEARPPSSAGERQHGSR